MFSHCHLMCCCSKNINYNCFKLYKQLFCGRFFPGFHLSGFLKRAPPCPYPSAAFLPGLKKKCFHLLEHNVSITYKKMKCWASKMVHEMLQYMALCLWYVSCFILPRPSVLADLIPWACVANTCHICHDWFKIHHCSLQLHKGGQKMYYLFHLLGVDFIIHQRDFAEKS